jgi:L-cysteate sulfo-lyase
LKLYFKMSHPTGSGGGETFLCERCGSQVIIFLFNWSFPMLPELPRVGLAHLPTPVLPLSRLSERLGGPEIFIKRDDLTGLAGGGNKTRKLEFLLADALAAGADCLVTLGSAQSNHCRQTAAAAVVAGMRCVLVLRGNPPAVETGNVLLDRLLGAEIVWCGERERETVMEEVVAAEARRGHRPHAIPLGGSTPLGAVGYALALRELVEQCRQPFDRIVVASSSGGTQAGLVAGAWLFDFRGEVLGISIDEEASTLREMVSPIASGTATLLGKPRRFNPSDVRVNADYLGGGYGVVGTPEREAIELFARTEGVLLDPVYTGRAAAGLIDLIRKGVIGRGETLLFWHTGGTPALYAYADVLRTRD